MSKLTKALTAAAGNAGGGALYVEDVFSTYLYEGTGSGIAINNGIDLSGEGGLVVYRRRDGAENWSYQDTERGVDSVIYSDSTNAAADPGGYGLASFNSNGFTTELNTSGADYASWTFRKAEKFFDVVTWTGDGAAGPFTLPHNLGATVGMSVVKVTSHSGDWITNHRSLPSNYLALNSTAAAQTDVTMTSTDSTITFNGSNVYYNFSGRTYVAYLFASDAGGFGDDGSESIIKCGSITTNWAQLEVDVGFEPQFVIAKVADRTDPFRIFDNMRGVTTGGNDAMLRTDEAYYEDQGGANDYIDFTPTGFVAKGELVYPSKLIYIAIRRPMKTPESGTEVFAVGTNQEVPSATSGFYSGFPVDMAIKRIITASQSNYLFDRLRGGQSFATNATGAESAFGAAQFDHQQGFYYDSDSANTDDYSWMFKRARGFFDVVTYTGTGVVRTVNHNLGVAPEFIICKNRQEADGSVYSAAISDTKRCRLFSALGNIAAENRDAGDGTNYGFTISLSTDSTIRSGIGHETNKSGYKFVAYLFATLAGVSKVGSYTGTGSNIDVDCGFSAGARFILIKRTDSASSWYLWDSKRGIVAGNDPWINLDTNNAQNSGQDAIDPLASGFTVTAAADVNQPGGTYTFLAIA